MVVKESTYFTEKDNLDGKKDISLIIDCSNCSQKQNNIFKSEKCLSCFLQVLYKYRDKKFDFISILSNNTLINAYQFNLFFDYFKVLKKIKKVISKIKNIRNEKCNYKEFNCKVLTDSFFFQILTDYELLNPILVYYNFEKSLTELKKICVNDSICHDCVNSILISEMSILKILDNLIIIQKYKAYKSEGENFDHLNSFYLFLFSRTPHLLDPFRKLKNVNDYEEQKIIISYHTGKYEIFKVNIFENFFDIENLYKVENFYKGKEQEDYFENITQFLYQNLEVTEFDKLISLDKLISIYQKEAVKVLSSKFKLKKNIEKKISFLTVLKKLNLEKLFPLLTDDFIEEIFLDSPHDEVYINHQTFGRCRTKIRFNLKEIERIKTFIRLYSGQRLDFTNPTIKFVIKNKYFNCRFSIDVEPIQINNFALDIRKLNKNILNIQDLLKNRTIDPLIAAFLYFNVIRRKNITVTGETDTGKTTLINALDLLTPKEFRKIYIENITESLNQFEYGKHQLKYRVDSLEESTQKKYSKSNQIKTLLHRTPDIIYLGEILTKDEAVAMFHCLAAGLRGFQTIHSKDIDSLMNRLIYHFRIDKSCLKDLDLIILMKKEFNERKVMGVYEVSDTQSPNKLNFIPIFEYNPETKKWILNKPLFEIKAISSLKKYEALTRENFLSFIKTYNEIFEFLLKNKKITNIEIVDLFHKVSYFSSKSIAQLRLFWKKWKNNRSLNQ